MPIFIFLLLSLAGMQAVYAKPIPSTVTLAATDWCPYTCENQTNNNPGIVHEYLSEVLQQSNIKLNIEYYPWHESIKKAQLGEVDGLLTAVVEEAPSLYFSTVPTYNYQVCFITRSNSNWIYKGTSSLNKIVLGSIKGYGYDDEIDQFIKYNSEKPNMKIVDSGGLEQFNKMLFENKIDAYLDDSRVVLWALRDSKRKVKLSGCLKRKPFYLAVNPNLPWANEFIALINKSLSDPINLQLLNSIKQNYR
ncbi:MAG: polar amino acid transport system substrate-binding protein [Psychrobacter glaciei]